MSDQPAAPTLTPEQLPDWTHLPESRLRELDPRTQRQVQARIARLLREAEQAEGAALAEVFDQLEGLQRIIRGTLAEATPGTPFAVLWNELERRIDETMAGVSASVVDRLEDAGLQGANLIDEILDAAGGTPLGSPPDVDTDGIRLTARQLLNEAAQNLKLRTTQQGLLYTSGDQTLERTLRAVGDQLKGSSVFGAPSARVARTVRTEMGEAYGAGTQARTRQMNATATGGGFVARKRWIWSHDSTGGRESHAFAEQRYAPGGSTGPIPTGASYRVGNFSTPYPRGPGLPGHEKINCGCRSVPVLMAVEPEEAA